MTQGVSAKCDMVIHGAIVPELQSACRQPRLAWGNPAHRKVRGGCTRGWHTPCFAVSKKPITPTQDHGQVRARIRTTLAHRPVEFDRWRGGGATCGRVAVSLATGSARRVGRTCFRCAQRVLNSEESNRPLRMPACSRPETVTGAQPPLRSIDPPCPLSSSRRAFFSFVENPLVAAHTRGLRSMI
jgi:hypothetical protein